MTAPKVDLSTIIHYLRERCGKETYASNLEMVQEFLDKHKNPPVRPHLGSEIDVEEVLCRSILVSARRLFEKFIPHSESLMFTELSLRIATELLNWREMGKLYYGHKAETPEELRAMIDKRMEDHERGRG